MNLHNMNMHVELALRSRNGTKPALPEAPHAPFQPLPNMGNYYLAFYHHRYIICIIYI